MSEAAVSKDELFARLPAVWPEPLLDQIRARVAASGQRLAIVDDDPTGAQTSHGIAVLTQWSDDLLAEEIQRSQAFFVLANTRALDEASAVLRAREIGEALRRAAMRTGLEIVVASRSDSTLRGHFPAEVEALMDATSNGDHPKPSVLFVPYFAEGGRFTLKDTQYVHQGDQLVPAAQTEFARDVAFAYKNSHLPSWVEEKSRGRFSASDVLIIGIEDLRSGGPETVAGKLLAVADGSIVIANAADDRDIEVLVLGLLQAEAAGKRFIYRTSASFVRVRAGLSTRPLLTRDEVRREGTTGGLVVVGSYIQKTSEQLARALMSRRVMPLEVDVDALLANRLEEDAEIARASVNASNMLAAHRDVVMYTSRAVRTGADPAASLAIGQRISKDLCAIVSGLMTQPRFLIAKGGSTSSDVAIAALGVQRVMVMGQLQPGVPVWQLGPESRYPGLPYVVYPGNVGSRDGLAEAIESFRL